MFCLLHFALEKFSDFVRSPTTLSLNTLCRRTYLFHTSLPDSLPTGTTASTDTITRIVSSELCHFWFSVLFHWSLLEKYDLLYSEQWYRQTAEQRFLFFLKKLSNEKHFRNLR